jgi:hypothetical protein
MLIVGFEPNARLYPTLISQNLNEQDLVKAEPCLIDVNHPKAKSDVVSKWPAPLKWRISGGSGKRR